MDPTLRLRLRTCGRSLRSGWLPVYHKCSKNVMALAKLNLSYYGHC
jgi:hypothetical protein